MGRGDLFSHQNLEGALWRNETRDLRGAVDPSSGALPHLYLALGDLSDVEEDAALPIPRRSSRRGGADANCAYSEIRIAFPRTPRMLTETRLASYPFRATTNTSSSSAVGSRGSPSSPSTASTVIPTEA